MTTDPEKHIKEARQDFGRVFQYIGPTLFEAMRTQAANPRVEGVTTIIEPGQLAEGSPYIQIDVRPEGVDFVLGSGDTEAMGKVRHLSMVDALDIVYPEKNLY